MSQRFRRRSSLLTLIPASALGLSLLALPTSGWAGPPPPPPPGGETPAPAAAGAPAPPPAPPPTIAPAGSPMAQGEAAYKAEDYEGAAIQFHKIASGEIPGDVPRGQFWLGKSLYKLESSLSFPQLGLRYQLSSTTVSGVVHERDRQRRRHAPQDTRANLRDAKTAQITRCRSVKSSKSNTNSRLALKIILTNVRY